MKVRLTVPSYIRNSVVDGIGCRTFIGFQSCQNSCYMCHNLSAHSELGGILVDIEEVKNEILKSKNDHDDGITFSGGEFTNQLEAAKELAIFAHSIGLDVWGYTGLTFEDMLRDESMMSTIRHIDVLVDGKYVHQLRDLSLKFRGSSNQRVISVTESLKKGNVVILNC